MSTRTIIEINHDRLDEAREELQTLIDALPSCGTKELLERFRGAVRVRAQRHHSDGVALKVNGHTVWVD